MFQKHLFCLGLVWMALVFLGGWMVLKSSLSAQLAYQQLIKLSNQEKKEKNLPTKQTRQQVSKQCLYQKGAQRLQSRLTSEHSELILHAQEGKPIEWMETLQNVTCTMQEPCLPQTVECQPQQSIRYFKAREAVYFYTSGLFKAEQVDMAHYLIPGTAWPDALTSFHPLMQGYTQQLQLSLWEKPTLQAQNFRASFHQGEENDP